MTQREIPVLAEVRPPRMVDEQLIKQCANARQALSLCIRLSGYTDDYVAKALGISPGYLSKILSGRASLDGDRRLKLMRICGNCAPLQYEAWSLGKSLEARAAEDVLREALALMEARRAA